MLAATVNASIVIIALPAIFRGINLDPLTPSNVSYLLWMLMGYLVVSAVLVVTLGRLGDIFGRVRMYNLGFTVFALGALALPFDPFTGPAGALWLIGWRIVQATGGAMLMANSPAILTDAFPSDQRGTGDGHQPGGGHLRQLHRPDPGRRAGRGGLAPGVHRVGADRDRRGHLVLLQPARDRAADQVADRLAGQRHLRARPDRPAHRHHLRHPALRRARHGLDQPGRAHRPDRRGRAAGRVLLHRNAGGEPHVRPAAAEDPAVRLREPGHPARLDRPWRPAVHADHLAAGHLAGAARLSTTRTPRCGPGSTCSR